MDETTEPDGETSAPDTPVALVPADAPIVAQRAITAPTNVDRAARTVEVVWSTGASARNFVAGLGPITEELYMRPEAVRMEALRGGNAPVQNTHRRSDATAVLGRVIDARIERGIGMATLQFSSASDVEPIRQRLLTDLYEVSASATEYSATSSGSTLPPARPSIARWTGSLSRFLWCRSP